MASIYEPKDSKHWRAVIRMKGDPTVCDHFERKQKAEIDMLRKEDLLTPDLVFRDPSFLEFLNLNDRYFEKDLEDAIMRELEQFERTKQTKDADLVYYGIAL